MVKLTILIFAYVLLAPAVGLLARRADWMRASLFVGMLLLTALPEDLWTVTPGNLLWFRGHANGFLFSIQSMAAVSLIVGCWKCRDDIRPARPFILFYGIWFFISSLSIVAALSIDCSLWAIWKHGQLLLIFIAAFLFIREAGDRTHSMIAIVLMIGICLQVPLVAKQRFLDGVDRPWGAFVHPNNLGMWAYLAALPVFALSLSLVKRWKLAALGFLAVGAAGIVILFSLSRAAIAIFALGHVLLTVVYWMATRDRKVGMAAGGIAALAVAVGILAGPKIVERFKSGDYLGETDLRTALNGMSAAMLKDEPLTGIGWNNFAVINSRPHPRYSPILEKWHAKTHGTDIDPRYFRRNPLPESVWWLALAETGYPGGLATLALLATSLWIVCRTALKINPDDPWRWLFVGIAVALSLTMAHTFIERILIVVTPVTTLWLIFTAAALARQNRA